MTEIVDSKSKMRSMIRQRVHHGLQSAQKLELDRKINLHLRQVLSQIPHQSCASFSGLQDEPDIQETALAESQILWAYPKVLGDQISFFKPEKLDELRAGAWGIAEPDPETSTEISLSSLDAVLVPGMAFDRRGLRLGRGKGYYDKALENYQGHKIGICYSFQVVNENLPFEQHDCQMNVVVTEKFVMWPTATRAMKH